MAFQRTINSGPRDEEFLLSEAPGFRSRDTRTAKEDSLYQPGTVLIAEHESTGGESPTLVATGLHVTATAARLTAWASVSYDALDAAIVLRAKDAADEDVAVAVIDCDAEVKDSELILGTGAELEDVVGLLSSRGIKIRQAI
jgi:hypothetical protein